LRSRSIRGFHAFLCASAFSSFICIGAMYAQAPADEGFDVLKYRGMTISIVARVTDKDQPELSWKSETSKLTIPGRPVGMKLVGANIIVLVQLTPYLTESNAVVLVAQGQVWISGKGTSLDYRTSLKTIPAAFGEKLFFFPLGFSQNDSDARIEMEIVVDPYKEPPKDQGKKDESPQQSETKKPTSP
jgi:hypothetical protein